jgi:small acid-soluble spore protein H (minor)
MASVTFDNMPVYIERVNEAQMTADIHFLDRPQVKKQIPLSRLVEHGNIY